MATVEYDIFDADNHYYEALDAFTRHLDPALGSRCVQWCDIDGRQYQVVGGRVRVLGGGTAEIKSSLKTWNGLPSDLMPMERGMVRVGFDVFGGVFALDGGALGPGDGSVHYFAPDSLSWEPLELGHSAWVHWLLTEPDKLVTFYEAYRLADDGARLPGLAFDQALALSPPPWSPEASKFECRPAPANEVVKDLLEASREKN